MDSVPLPSLRITIETGETIIIDAEDEAKVRAHRWRFVRTGGKPGSRSGCYVMSAGRIYLHRLIMGEPAGMLVDHRDRNTLDCRKDNLRVATRQQSARNRGPNSNAGRTSKYKGVCWEKKTGKWLASIYANGVLYRLGNFLSEEFAAGIYDDASHALHGEFGFRNFPARPPQPIELKTPRKKSREEIEAAAWRAEILRS